MARVLMLVDGFNIYHALDINPGYHKYKWMDLNKLGHCYLTSRDQLVDILFFTAYATWNPDKVRRHQHYVRVLEAYGVTSILGKFQRRTRTCRICNGTYSTFEEKETDVNIAIRLFQAAINNQFDTALIVSGDSDLIPSIRAVKDTFPAKKIGVVIPIGRSAEALKKECDSHMKMKIKHLRTSRFPDDVDIGDGHILSCPAEWR